MGVASEPPALKNQGESQDLLIAEVLEYRRVLLSEVSAHRRFSKLAVLTGLALFIGGLVTVYYYSALGWLLTILGLLRSLNSFYDFHREDELQKRLRLIEQRFGRH